MSKLMARFMSLKHQKSRDRFGGTLAADESLKTSVPECFDEWTKAYLDISLPGHKSTRV